MDGKPGVSGSRIFGSQSLGKFPDFWVSSLGNFRIFGWYFFGQIGTPLFVMSRGYPPRLEVEQ